MARRNPCVYFSFRSPFSWIAMRLLEERSSPEQLERITFVPYWEPDQMTLGALQARGANFLYAAMSKEKHLYILQDIKRMTQSLGYRHVWPMDDNPWWELPNLAYLAAVRRGKGPEFRALAYQARWERGDNIHTVETIRQLARELALDPEEICGASDDPEIREQAASALHQAYEHGVFGVPFFVSGFDKFWGLDRLHAFLDAMNGRKHRYLTLEMTQ